MTRGLKNKWFLFWLVFCVAVLTPLHAQNGTQLRLAERFIQAGDPAKALALYEQLYKQDPTLFIYSGYLKCLQELNRYDEAEKLVRRQMKHAPVPVLLKVDLAQNYLLSGNAKKADATLREIVEKTDFSQAGLSLEELAEAVVKKTKNYGVAIEVYLKSRTGGQFDENATRPYAMQLANLYRLSGQYEPMLEEYLDVLRHETGREDEVYTRLQGLVAGSSSTEGILNLIARQVQKSPNDPAVQNLYIWALLQEKNYEAALNQARIYTNRFNDKGSKWLQMLQTLRDNARYELSRKGYEEFIDHAASHPAHYNQTLVRTAKIELLNLYFHQLERNKVKDSLQVQRIKNDYKRLFNEVGNGAETYSLYRNLAKIYAYYSGQRDSAEQLLRQALAQSGFNAVQKAQLKIDIADILLFYNKVWDATLLYSQVEKDFKQDPIGFYAKLQNARLSYYIGEFEWAESQLHVLRAATSKLIANDAMELSLLIKEGMNPDSAYDGLRLMARADFLVVRHLYAEAFDLLNQILTMPLEGALFGEVYWRKAQIYLKLDAVEESLTELERIYKDYAEEDNLLADDALFMAAGLMQLRAGIAIDPETEFLKANDFPPAGSEVFGTRTETERTADREAAMALYQQLFTDYKSSALAPLARQRYRQLRGR